MLNRVSYILLLGLLTLCAFLYINYSRQVDQPEATFVGVDRCRVCHESARFGGQFGIWANSAHAHAAQALAGDSARAYLAAGKGNPAACLSCHTTLGRAAQNEKEKRMLAEGVGCERCHGAGSTYADFHTMVNRSRFTSSGGVVGSLQDCYQCHARQPHQGDASVCPFQRTPFNADSAWKSIRHPIVAGARTFDTVFKTTK
ncbi:MAG TPA: multiheme c-type cytochrome [Candidatus Kapabacteria bacterium]|nr:multiheme c-type cytochrome [Candidatus Kapabacteria bacterium]